MKIELAPLVESEFPLIVDWVNAHDKDFIFQWAGDVYRYPLTVQQMEDHYRKGMNSLDSGVFIYKIVDLDTQEVLGSVQLGRIDLAAGEAVVGRFLIKSEHIRGKGIGTKVLQELVGKGFNEFALNRIRLNVFDINPRAIRCYEKVGFKRGTMKENVYLSSTGVSWNGIEMTLDKDQWKKAQEGIDIL